MFTVIGKREHINFQVVSLKVRYEWKGLMFIQFTEKIFI